MSDSKSSHVLPGAPLRPLPQVTKTIEQMVRFIRQEAEEKASEIAVATEEEVGVVPWIQNRLSLGSRFVQA